LSPSPHSYKGEGSSATQVEVVKTPFADSPHSSSWKVLWRGHKEACPVISDARQPRSIFVRSPNQVLGRLDKTVTTSSGRGAIANEAHRVFTIKIERKNKRHKATVKV